MFELEAKGQEEGTHELKKRLAVTKQLMIGRFMLKIDGDGPVCAGLFGRFVHVSPPGHRVASADQTRWGQHFEISR